MVHAKSFLQRTNSKKLHGESLIAKILGSKEDILVILELFNGSRVIATDGEIGKVTDFFLMTSHGRLAIW